MQPAVGQHCGCKWVCELLTLYTKGFTVLLKSFGLYNVLVTTVSHSHWHTYARWLDGTFADILCGKAGIPDCLSHWCLMLLTYTLMALYRHPCRLEDNINAKVHHCSAHSSIAPYSCIRPVNCLSVNTQVHEQSGCSVWIVCIGHTQWSWVTCPGPWSIDYSSTHDILHIIADWLITLEPPIPIVIVYKTHWNLACNVRHNQMG